MMCRKCFSSPLSCEQRGRKAINEIKFSRGEPKLSAPIENIAIAFRVESLALEQVFSSFLPAAAAAALQDENV
jgi:hypothetical protein